MFASSEPPDESPRTRGLPDLPPELLRKIAKEFSSRSQLQSFALVCRATTLPARELLFDTLTLSNQGATLLSPDYLLFGKTRLFPFPDLARRLVLFRDTDMLALSPVDLAFVLHDLPNVRTIDISGQFWISMPQQASSFHTCFANIDRLRFKTSDKDCTHETLRVLLHHCRNLTKLELGTDLVTLEDPSTPWHFATRKRIPTPASLDLPSLHRLTLRSPLYLALPTMNLVSHDSLSKVRTLELDLAEESIGRAWDSGSIFPIEFFEFFGSSIEHLYFNFPLYSKRSNVETLSHLLVNLKSLRTLSLGSVSSGATWLLLGLPPSCTDIFIHNEDGSPDWMGLHRFFLENEGEPALEELRGRRIWIDRSDCKFCDQNFQRETENKCERLGIELVVPAGEGKKSGWY